MSRTRPPSSEYSSVPIRPAGARGLRSPPAHYDSMPASRQSPNRVSRAGSDYSTPRSPPSSPKLRQATAAHPYPMRELAHSPNPSYGELSTTGDTPGWQSSTATLGANDYLSAGKRGSRATTLRDAGASSIMLEKYDYADQDRRLLSREAGKPLPPVKKGWSRRRKLIVFALIFVLIVIAAALGGYYGSRNKSSSSSSASKSGSNADAASGTTNGSTTSDSTANFYGSDGSMITAADGSTFRYNNTYGGHWVSIPFNDTARAASDVPPLNEQWDYSANLMRAVNLGGWLADRPFITPSLFEPYTQASTPAIDEWTLCENLGDNKRQVIENHYKTFITEVDFARIVGSGLNWIRLPVPFWMIETYEGEPFLEGVAWQYFVQGLEWARKYGLRVELDLHTAPGSQNGLNHGGKLGSINFLNGPMGIANAQRHLNYVRTLTEFVSQPQYRNVVAAFMPLNEAYLTTIGEVQLRSFYLAAYDIIRSIGGVGQGQGPMMIIHDGFVDKPQWFGFLAGADRLALESHPYLAFSGTNSDSLQSQQLRPCQYWAAGYNQSMAAGYFTTAGEWSLAVNDCGQFVNGVNQGVRYDGTFAGSSTVYGNCDQWTDYTKFDDQMKGQLRNLALSYMDMSSNWAFWTWKTGVSNSTGLIANPLWSYSLGLANGWIPTDPRSSVGACKSLAASLGQDGGSATPLASSLPASATGGAGNSIAADQRSSYGQWPPASLTNIPDAGALPTYTPTGSVITLSASQPAASAFPTGAASTAVGNGWYQPSDTAGYFVPISGSSYPDAWNAAATAGSGERRQRRRSSPSRPTPAPS